MLTHVKSRAIYTSRTSLDCWFSYELVDYSSRGAIFVSVRYPWIFDMNDSPVLNARVHVCVCH